MADYYFISKDPEFSRECRELAEAGPDAGTLTYKVTFPSGAIYNGSDAEVLSVTTLGGKYRGPEDNWFLPSLPESEGLLINIRQKAQFKLD